MKPSSFFASRVVLAALILLSTVALLSWDRHQGPGHQQQTPGNDTIPQQRERKVRDLDEVLAEMDEIDLKVHIEKAMANVAEAMKQLDAQKIQLEVQKAMQEVNMEKIKEDVQRAMKEVDLSKIKAEMEASLSKVDMEKVKEEMKRAMKEIDQEKIQAEIKASMEKVNWDEIKSEMDKAKQIDFAELEKEMKKVKEEMKNIEPKLKEELAKAKVEIEKAKEEVREYKNFVDGLEKDGLLNKKEDYSIRHKDGKLTINGKEVSPQIYSKYRNFLEKHKELRIEKNEDHFNIDNDDDKLY